MEQWKDIPWREGMYQASNIWRVKSFKYWKVRILTNTKGTEWYEFVRLCYPWVQSSQSVHRLVMWAFHWPSKLEVNHLNGIKNDNRLENLEYCTASDNVKHSIRVLGRRNHFMYNNPNKWVQKFWKDNSNSKKVCQYDKDMNIIRYWHSARDAHREVNIDYNWIIQCCRGEYKTSGGFIWRYIDELPECKMDTIDW